MNWHSLDVDDVLEELNASPRDGLSQDDARRRLDEHGPNRLEEEERAGPLRRFLRQFKDALIYVLLAAALLTALMQHWIDTGVILAVVIINAIIGFVQEGKAEQALESIREMLSLEARVLRDSDVHEVSAEDLVPGDIVFVESGDRIPADLRLIEAEQLQVEEAALTGESAPVDKQVESVEEEAGVGDRASMIFSGTTVARGKARGVVVATGEETEVGQIGEMVAGVEELTTPLQQKVQRFARWLSVIIVGLSLALLLVNEFLLPYAFSEMLLIVVSLAVAAIPQGLPAIMTVTLALGVRRMAERNAITRRLPAVETLGSVTVICADKTGTLTRNEMTPRKIIIADGEFDVTGEGYEPEGEIKQREESVEVGEEPLLEEFIRAGALCNNSRLTRDDEGGWTLDGEPTEGALTVLAARAGFEREEEEERYERLDEVPFESERQYMATLHEVPDGGRVIYIKGAPEKILSLCEKQRTEQGEEELDESFWQEKFEEVAREGHRLLALAMKSVEGGAESLDEDEIDAGAFVLLGMIAMIDPPRKEAIEAIEEAHRAGINVKMMTGDHVATAQSIAERMEIGEGKEAIEGKRIEEASDSEMDDIALNHDVFARSSPEHKLRLVEALQRHGEVVAMTGDGVNDAPALKRANVGVAMGIKGSEAAKEAAEIVLADDNFASIERAIFEGRTIYNNLKKTILFVLPTNGAESLIVLTAVILVMEQLPITPLQILWVNMITAVTLALSLAFEPPERDVMDQPPRDPDEPLISGQLLLRILLVSVFVGGLAMYVFFHHIGRGVSLDVSRTIAVNTLVAGQLFYLFNTRFLMRSAFRLETLTGNRISLLSVAALIGFQLIFTYVPLFHTLFDTGSMTLSQWLWPLAVGVALFIVVEIEKAIGRKRGEKEKRQPAQRPREEPSPA